MSTTEVQEFVVRAAATSTSAVDKTLLQSDSKVFHEVLDEVLAVLDRSGVPYLLMGGIAATALANHRRTHDIDVFLKPSQGDEALRALGDAGFDIERTDPTWLFKAWKKSVMVDLIFSSSGPIFLDDEMLEHARVIDFNGRQVRILCPEDLFVIKALVLSEHNLSIDPRCMRHLTDLLFIARTSELDCDYLVKRARCGPRRVLSMLIYAQSVDLLVPARAIRELIQMLEIA